MPQADPGMCRNDTGYQRPDVKAGPVARLVDPSRALKVPSVFSRTAPTNVAPCASWKIDVATSAGAVNRCANPNQAPDCAWDSRR
jgi:hypothetical protein